MSHYLFLFTIGPVQSFIAQARKTQDLYAGSRILSVLIKEAMHNLKHLCPDVNFIFPTEDSESKPNRFSAIVTADENSIQEIGNKVKTATECYFIKNLGKKVIELQPDSILQLNDFLKIYWVAHEVKLDEKGEIIDYPIKIKQAEKYLGATKNIRYFNQLQETGRKCALNGEYNVKFYRLGDKEQKNDRLYDKKLFNRDVLVLNSKQDYKTVSQAELQEGEGLCAISMLKRFFPVSEAFPSVAEIALMYDIEKLSPEMKDCFEEYKTSVFNQNEFVSKCLKEKIELNISNDKRLNTHFDHQMLYDDSITEKNFPVESQKKLAKKYIDKLKKELKCKYYAILVFDADGMGDKLAECKTKEEHKKLSELLGKYGKSATKYIDNNKLGQTIYAGGDDFLGFLNLNHLFEAMQKLREMFNLEVNTHLPERLKKLTFSAGIAIAHYKTPLSEVLNYARIMEKKAKKVENKNDNELKKDAFAMAVLKHSGEIHDTMFRWTDNNCHWSTETLKNLTNHLKNKDISDNFISNLSSEFAKLLDKNGGWGENNQNIDGLNKIFEHELVRFVKRAKTEEKSIDNDFCSKLNALYLNHCAFDLNVQNFLNALHICEFISRHLNKDKN